MAFDLTAETTAQGFKVLLRIEDNWVAATAIATAGVVGLGAFYIAHKHYSEIAAKRALEKRKDDGTADPQVESVTESSILVELRFHTVQSFLSFLDDLETKEVKHRLQEEFCKIGFRRDLRVTIDKVEQVSKMRSTMPRSVTDNEKRWLVFGMALNKVLVTQIRSFIAEKVREEYGKLRKSHSIHAQRTADRLEIWKEPLKYENINGNNSLLVLQDEGYDYSKFDCKVTSYVDFAKLYVEDHMAKFDPFDEHRDASAIFALLRQVPLFSSNVGKATNGFRQDRNAWVYCVFNFWDEINFQKSFNKMEELTKALGLSSATERELLGELKDWKQKGMNEKKLKDVQELVKTLKKEVGQLTFEVQKDKERVLQALEEISTSPEEQEPSVLSPGTA